MKTRTTSIVVALTLGVCAFSVSAEQADPRATKARSLYQQGLTAMNAGQYNLAETSFRGVLKLYPTHPQARKKLNYIRSNQNTLETGQRKKEMRKVVIPKVDIDKASLQEALDVLSAHIKQASRSKTSPNFIVQDRSGGFTGKVVTLNLSNVPADTLLKYIVDQVGGVAKFDSHAIIIKPRAKSGG
jgi:hypothetical protein